MDCTFYLFNKVKINTVSIKIVYNFQSGSGGRGWGAGNAKKGIERRKQQINRKLLGDN